MWLPHSFIVLLLPVLARGSNITVDDSDPSFTFTGTWNAITPTSACSICSSNPDPSRIQGGTWHDGNYRDGAPVGTSGSFTFTGSAVYIFGIDQAISQPNIAFTLGSIQQVHHYTGTERFVYRALFFSADGLDADQTHTVNWVFNLAPNTGVEVQVALFDYAIVTSGKEDEKVTSSSTAVAAGLVPSQSSTNNDNKATSGSDSSTVSRSSASGGSQSNGGPSQSTSSINPTILPGDQSSSPSTITMSEMSLTTVTAQSAQLAISHSKSNIGAIVGGVVGALMVVTLAILFIWLRSRKVIRVSPEKDPSARSQFLRIENYPMSNSLHPTDMHEVGVPLSSFKRYEGRMGGPSTTSLLTPSDDLSTPIPATPESSTLFRPSPETEPPAPSATSRDLRLMEERLATLEAQIAVHQHPPPYVNEDDE